MRKPPRLVTSSFALLLLALVAGYALAQPAPDAATWTRQHGTVFDPWLGRETPAMIGEVYVDWQPGVTEAEKAAIRAESGAVLFRAAVNTTVEALLVAPGRETEVIIALNGRPEVREAMANRTGFLCQDQIPSFEPNDARWGDQRALHRLTRSPQAWALFPPDPMATGPNANDPSVGDPEVIVAIIDTGVDYEHADLTPNIWVNMLERMGQAGRDDDANGYVDDIYGYDFYDNDGDPKPRPEDPGNAAQVVGHGTHCAGIACAKGNNRIGVAGQTWNCKIMCIKIADDDTAAIAAVSDVVAALRYVVDNGADIVNMSWAFQGQAPQAVMDVIQAGHIAGPVTKNWHRQGVVWVAAMGNSTTGIGATDQWPVGAETEDNEVVGVCAVQSTGKMTDYTNWGTTLNVADISAPGGSYTGGTDEGILYWSTWLYIEGEANFPEYYGTAGTSMAAPHVAGVAALVRSLDPSLPAADVITTLRENANRDLLYRQNPAHEPTEGLGAGIVDAYLSCEAVGSLLPVAAVVSPPNAARIMTTTPVITIQANKKARRAPALVRVTLRVNPAAGSTPTDADAVWLDYVNNETGVTGPDGLDDRTGVEYPATGRFERRTTTPLPISSTGIGLHTVEVTVRDDRVPPEDVVVTSVFRISAVGISRGRRLFSVPYQLYDGTSIGPATPQTVLAQNVGGVGEAQIARWNPATASYVRSDVSGTGDPYISILEPGKSYWLDLPVDTPRLIIQGADLSTSAGRWLIRDAAYTDTSAAAQWLQPGWHMIADPFPFPISLASLQVETASGDLLPLAAAVQAQVCRGVIYRYANGTYAPEVLPAAVLAPFEGYWFRTLEKCKLWAVPTEASISGAAVASAASGQALWTLDLDATARDRTSRVTVGSAAGGTDGFDERLDMEQPPPLDEPVVLTVGGGAGKPNGLLRDVRGLVTDSAVWTITAQVAAGTTVDLAWGDLRGLPREFAASITDMRTGKTTSLRHDGIYRFESGDKPEVRQFTLTVARVDAAKAFRVVVEDLSMTRGVATVSFRLTGDADVDCHVLNAAGRVVRTLAAAERMAAGTRSLTWDGRSDTGALLPSGAYRIEVRARSDRAEVARGSVSIAR